MGYLTGTFGQVLVAAMSGVLGVALAFLFGEGIVSLMLQQTAGCMGLF